MCRGAMLAPLGGCNPPLQFRKDYKIMNVHNPQFEISAVGPKQYPIDGLPEIVLAGKSNVGKSSFINTMINRKSLARTSSQPGKTRQINFYNIDQKFHFVDLPGFGYSKMSKQEQAKVGKFIEEYLFSRKEIALIILLIDIRHAPSENDVLMFNYIRSIGTPYLVIANKADKIAPTKVPAYVEKLKEYLQANETDIILPFSSQKKIYTENVWNEIIKYIM